MAEQIFISYRRDGGDVTAKLICEKLKNLGYTVFYDYDSIGGGHFDSRIYKAIEACNDVVLVLPPHSLDRCVNPNDWVRMELCHALKHKKNIVPVLLPGFEFPKEMPDDIKEIARFNGVQFVMAYFEAVVDAIVRRLATNEGQNSASAEPVVEQEEPASEGLAFEWNAKDNGYVVSMGDCTDTDVVIPRTYNGESVTSIGARAFDGCKSLASITIPDSVTSIDDGAFSGCESLTSITIPDSVTNIGDWAFSGCESLASITIPDSVTNIGDSAFRGCISLTGTTIPNSVTSIGDGAFMRCEFLTSITIPDSVTSIGFDAFYGCKFLTSITIPDSVTSIGFWAFFECESLTSITIPDSVTSIGGGVFSGCQALKQIRYAGTVQQWENIEKRTDFLEKSRVSMIHCTDGTIKVK